MSFHLLHVQLLPNGRYLKLYEKRLPTKFGDASVHSGEINAHTWHKGMADLAILQNEIAILAPDKTVIVGTSPLRDVSNAHAFVTEVKMRFGMDIKILSAEQEAEITFLGAADKLTPNNDTLAVVDLGGGSLEIAFGRGTQYVCSHNANTGVFPLRDGFQIDDAVGPVKARAIAEAIRLSLRSIVAYQPHRVVYASGAGRSVYQLANAVLPDVHPQQMTLHQARKLRDYVVGRSCSEFHKKGVSAHRMEVVAIATIVLETTMTMMSALTAEFSTCGLREGLALHENSKQDCPSPPSVTTDQLAIW